LQTAFIININDCELLEMTLKKVVKLLTPPIVFVLFKKIKSQKDLFDGRDAKLFIENAYKSKTYGEYGVGYSTLKVRNESMATIIAVETNENYLNQWRNDIKPKDTDILIYYDIGDIIGLGYPINYNRRNSFIGYFESIWTQESKPDFVLIDGRFRVACFLTSVLLANPGTMILFDDYDREYYHVVEEIIKPSEVTLTQGLFIVPSTIDKVKAIELRNLYSMVML